ncbi:zinc finger CCCH domain-containing protein 3 [Phlebotomus argentipes]|uniref:zinc finger CCCH domain-containing protein 3 n=1 Tax=Phlebotomus argentipes TaxID=94469 RepID=UPI0028933164|nr:zinc finger CCCH domain-containing protein 3 [Phlebotomus argentipes]
MMEEEILPVKFKKIHINPKFRNAHINPSFFTKHPALPANIHVNPKFLGVPQHVEPRVEFPQKEPIYKTRRKIIRNVPSTSGQRVKHTPTTRLVKISKNKLVRTSSQALAVPPQSLRRRSLYKIDRRHLSIKSPPQNLRKLRSSFSPKIVTTTNKKLMRIGTSFVSFSPRKLSRIADGASKAAPPASRKLSFLNINGVLYKSTANKLQKSSGVVQTVLKSLQDRVLFIRGEKFTMDGSGKRLRKCNASSTALKLTRIHFGGLTYTSKKNGTYERTNSHFTRTHLSIAKQRSISFLANKMVKSNLPCLIYRRLGKCLAKERGRCHRVHDPDQVAVCRKFLKGACKDAACLLAHKADLSKMPTCKFFLEGCCTASDCPYLHKKLNEKTEICRDFLQGFCKLAEKCSKRHDLICPDAEAKGVCEKPRCPFPHPQKRIAGERVAKSDPPSVLKSDKVRYFREECDQEAIELSQEAQERLARTLAKIDRMKRNYRVTGESLAVSESVEIVPSVPVRRPPIGDLPSFIPF